MPTNKISVYIFLPYKIYLFITLFCSYYLTNVFKFAILYSENVIHIKYKPNQPQGGGYKMENYELARTILGNDFITPEEVMKSCREITYTKEQLAIFRRTIPGQEILEWCRDTQGQVG